MNLWLGFPFMFLLEDVIGYRLECTGYELTANPLWFSNIPKANPLLGLRAVDNGNPLRRQDDRPRMRADG
jgi:hypothetical protein